MTGEVTVDLVVVAVVGRGVVDTSGNVDGGIGGVCAHDVNEKQSRTRKTGRAETIIWGRVRSAAGKRCEHTG